MVKLPCSVAVTDRATGVRRCLGDWTSRDIYLKSYHSDLAAIYLDYFYDYSLQDRCPYLLGYLGYREIEMGFIPLLFTTIHKTISEFRQIVSQFSNNYELTVATMQNVRRQCVISTNAVMSFSNLLK